MRTRSLTALVICFAACFALVAGLDTRKQANEPATPTRVADAAAARVLPGILADGSVQLPNQWRIRPAGKQIEVGNFPVNGAIHPSGQYLAVLHAGMLEHEVVVIDLNKARQ